MSLFAALKRQFRISVCIMRLITSFIYSNKATVSLTIAIYFMAVVMVTYEIDLIKYVIL
jgi:hypothetical protein